MARLLSAVSPGTLVKLNESGSPVEFYVAAQNYESGLNGAGRTLLVRKDVYQNGQWNASNINTYANSTIDQLFNGAYKALLDPCVQTAIGTTTFYYTPGNGNYAVTTLGRPVFALSLTELGVSQSLSNNEGQRLSISSTLKIAYLNGKAVDQWTRSPRNDNANYIWAVQSSGGNSSYNAAYQYGNRPCFTLPNNLYVKDNGNAIVGFAPASITTPALIVTGNSVPVSWDGVSGADSYILQRKADSGEWTQVYAGSDATFTDTAGSWSTVQYQVCGVFDGTNGAFAQSDVITVVPASTLVISGENGDLGTITSDISYSVATDTGNPISLTLAVNGAQFFSGSVGTSYTSKIPVMDLPTGTNTIVITATVQSASGEVPVKRTWTYTKAAQTFPGSGGVAQLAKDGQNVFPLTLAEAVKAIGGPWGGNLSTALDKLALAAVFNREVTPKYTKVNVDLSTAKSGDIVNLPINGVMVPHIVVQVGNPAPEMYDSSCDGVWLLRKDIVENGQWNSNSVNTLSGSTIMSTMQGYVDDYDPAVQAAIQTVKIPYCVGNGSATVNTLTNGLECKMFPLGAYELGWTTEVPNIPADGTKLQYFQYGNNQTANSLRLAALNGATTYWFLRSQNTLSSNTVYFSNTSGTLGGGLCTTQYGYRPCFTLPTTFTASYYVDQSGTVHAEQEYTTAGDFYDLWGNVVPSAKITVGNYTGTGGLGRPNAITLVIPDNCFLLYIRKMSGSSMQYSEFAIFTPPLYSENYLYSGYIVFRLGNSSIFPPNQGSNVVKLIGNELTWYANNNNADVHLNESGAIYEFVALSIS